MLIIARDMGSFSFRQLMDIYVEGNLENGQELFPDLSREAQIAAGEEQFLNYLRDCFFQTPGAFYAIRQVEDRYVSALRLSPNRDGFLLEALETAPDCRRRGHAKALIRDVVAVLGDTKVYSHVSKSNAASLAAHRACGFSVFLDCAQYSDGSVMYHACTLCRGNGDKNGTCIR